MPLVTDYHHVKDIYQEAGERGIALPVFCGEDRETLEAILASALEMGRRIGVEDLPIVPAWTCRYPPRGQMTLITACGDPILGMRLMFSDIDAFMSETSPYRKLRVLPHLDHAFPWLDGDVLEVFADRFASVMCDASRKPLAENMSLTARYVEQVAGKVVVEGAVDEIFEADGAGPKNEPTTVPQAGEFLRQTGVDIVVPNVGTEHRATAARLVYRPDRARELAAAVGRILCLHGTSSVPDDDLSRLPDDGFVKVNVYTTLAVRGGQALARRVLASLSDIFTESQLEQLVQEGVLGKHTLASEGEAVGPKLDSVANPRRRDAWFCAVRDRCRGFLEAFHYERYAG